MSPIADGSSDLVKSLVHDLGNLAYRLTFLTANLQAQIPDAGHREEALALLRDTTTRLQEAIEKLREVGKDG